MDEYDHGLSQQDSDEEVYLEMIQTWEDEEDDSIPELYFSNADPYVKRALQPDDYPRPDYRIDEQGRIVVKNLSAWWIPEMKVVEKIGGTLYTVTGSYEGTEMLDQKLARIMLRNLEDSE